MKTSVHSAIERSFEYSFRDEGLLRQALTPPSAGLPLDNQRLEFLGDSVLHLCATRMTYDIHPEWQEGALSRLRGKIVSTSSLYDWAMDLDIALARGPRTPKKWKPSHKEMADAIEALLAAILLDTEAQGKDGFAQVYRVVEKRFCETVKTTTPDDWEKDDPKTALQEKAAAMGMSAPKYELLERTGPDHAPIFLCAVKLDKYEAEASGPTMKRAQTEAARLLLRLFYAG